MTTAIIIIVVVIIPTGSLHLPAHHLPGVRDVFSAVKHTYAYRSSHLPVLHCLSNVRGNDQKRNARYAAARTTPHCGSK